MFCQCICLVLGSDCSLVFMCSIPKCPVGFAPILHPTGEAGDTVCAVSVLTTALFVLAGTAVLSLAMGTAPGGGVA